MVGELHYIAVSYFDWFIPADRYFNPEILSAKHPWYEAFSLSLYAGFFEECLFRAIPIAAGALIGTRFRKRGLFIFIALILQAIMFGSAHTWYLQEPAHARIFELFLPSILYGLFYIRFGLLPIIISHCLYGIIIFSTPIFKITSLEALTNQIILLAIVLLPLAIIIVQRLRQKAWIHLGDEYYN
ncbi:MAG: hypothetical protein A2Y62_02125 [Candidatus Fischerbacteria bacterium RBG_13_37_8]|uniref:CAAX prenyl protease 2/Lysostaphin resistance protein A-like domain-containing protein n=1 Tax=Candidatus Fischerbacteria bacterium RBG_13_37_8 TaxID=1817863 RepID=A0A1F5VJS8_9BACT|nr:MAG: hypothetical protein A2Y62_02125 [Candidatus Fischerbacteria bacterium RBG_13_37_8]